MVLKKVDIVELDRQEKIANDLKASMLANDVIDYLGFDLTDESLEELHLKKKQKEFILNNWKIGKFRAS